MIPVDGHLDNLWTWNPTAQKWELKIDADTGLYLPNEAFLAISDKPYNPTQPANSGARVTQGSNLQFTGVSQGNPIWYALASNPGIGEAYPGFRNNQQESSFGQYFETDSRLPQPQNLARPWITVAIGNVFHDGLESPKFSMWSGNFNSPSIWASTSNGQPVNSYIFAASGHNHVNWTFGATGIYRIEISASAFLGPGATNPTGTSPIEKITFAVGPVAYWQCLNFEASEIEDATIVGMQADPDSDGVTNIIEYAFGTDPNGGAVSLAGGLGPPKAKIVKNANGTFFVISYPRRKALQLTNPLTYTPQFSADLSANSWIANGSETVSAYTGPQTPLNQEWEKIESWHQISNGGSEKGYMRVKVEFAQ